MSIYFQYTCHFTPYVFLASVLGLERLRLSGATKRWPLVPALLAVFSCSLLSSYQFGAILQHNTAYSGFGPFHFHTTPADLKHRAARSHILSLLPPGVPVAASDCLVPHVSARKNAYNFQGQLHDAEYLVSEVLLPCAPSPQSLLTVLRDGKFGVIGLRPHYVILQRGASTARNDELRQMIRTLQRDAAKKR